MTDEEFAKLVREEAERRVLLVRGASDAPGFETCVEAEIASITSAINKAQ